MYLVMSQPAGRETCRPHFTRLTLTYLAVLPTTDLQSLIYRSLIIRLLLDIL